MSQDGTTAACEFCCLTSVCCGRGLTPRPTRCSFMEARAGLGRPRRRNARR